jgi:hypothetical protein
MEPIQFSETSAYKIQTPGNYPEDNILKKFTLQNLRAVQKCNTALMFLYAHQSANQLLERQFLVSLNKLQIVPRPLALKFPNVTSNDDTQLIIDIAPK